MIRVGFRWLQRGHCRHPEIMTIKGGRFNAINFPALMGVITHPTRGVFLFDTGYDPAFLEATHPFPERFYRWTTPVSISPAQDWQTWLAVNDIEDSTIVGTIISHFHGDHIAGLRHLSDRPIYCARAGLSEIRKPGRVSRVRQGLLPTLVPPSADRQARFYEEAPSTALPRAFSPFSEGRDILGDGSLIALELPGHCVGHWGLAFTTENDRPVLLAADAVWSGRTLTEHRLPPRITQALLGNHRDYRDTISKLCLAAHSNKDLAILPSHCSESAQVFRCIHAD